MEQVINNLKSKEIIYKKSVEVLKKYIENKYPEASDSYRAQVFADAVHKIIDDHIREFKRSDQQKIKTELLTTAASKESFEIAAYDIMKTCVALEINEATFIDHMTSWINRQQDIPVYRDQLIEITEVVREEIRQEAVQAAEVASFIPDEDLMKQLEAAFDYEPNYSRESDELKPELYTEGEVNEAYEAEMRKDMEKKPSLTTESDMSVFFPSEMSRETDEDQELESAYEAATVSESKHENPPYSFELGDNEQDEEMPTESEDMLEDRPIRTVMVEPEPYFSDTPELWEEVTEKKSFLDEVREALKGKNIKKILVMALIVVIGFAVAIWLIYLLVNGRFGAPDELPLQETEAITSPVTGVEAEDVGGSEDVYDETLEAGKTGVRSKSSEHLHDSLKYKEIDSDELRDWFVRNGSLVGEAPYFDTILEVAEDYGVNPLLLFAITGQEQGFVPRNHEFALEMINNPFNVYGSWETYNTDLKESAQIAARTVLTGSENRPSDRDPIEWLNNTYAEDKNWSAGVNIILEQLEIVAGN